MYRLVITADLGFEVWQDIPGFEGLYQASTYGRIKNKKCGNILKPVKHHSGYCLVSICGVTKNIHRLIALTFLPKPQEGQTQINHKSEVKTENQVWNLEWCNAKYNTNYGTRNGRNSLSRINHPNISKRILQFDLKNNFIEKYLSLMDVERQLGFSHQNIYYCCCGKTKSAYGFIWQYADN